MENFYLKNSLIWNMIDRFHPKILEFLYKLSRLDKYYSDRELAKRIKIQGNQVTSKTIRRWFDFLHTTCFDYHPYIHIEKLGLQVLYLFYPLTEGLIESNYTSYLNISISLKNMEKNITHGFWIPHDIGKEVLDKKKFQNYNFFHSKEALVGPLHKMFDKKGNIMPLKELDFQQEQDIKKLLYNLKHPVKPYMIKEVKNNPLIIPVAFEYDKEHWSSVEVWNQILNKLGEEAWKYFRKIKKKTKYVAIKRIQLTLKELSSLGLIKFMNVNYAPLEERNHYVWIYASINNETMKYILEELSLISPFIYIYSSVEDHKYLFTILIPNYLLDYVLSLFIDNSEIIDVYLVDYNSSQPLWNRDWLKFSYHKNFDPDKREWQHINRRNSIINNIINYREILSIKENKKTCGDLCSSSTTTTTWSGRGTTSTVIK